MTKPRTILFIQYGDFAEAFHRLRAAGPETYRDQKQSVEYVTDRDENSVIVSLSCDHAPERLTPNVLALGIPVQRLDRAHVHALFDTHTPDLLVLRTPYLFVLQEALRRRIPTLPCFADLFETRGLRQRLYNWKLGRALASDQIACICNHNLNASQSMATVLGVSRDRIVPWDWSRIPAFSEAKTYPDNPPRLFFAGALTEEKGLGDTLSALAQMKTRGRTVLLSVAGGGIGHWQGVANSLNIAEHVNWLGTIPNTKVREEMRAHDIVVVPSRHSYPEGLPNTIYEGLASRSPLLISDHPAFRGRIPDQAACVFRAGDPSDMAEKIIALLDSPGLYAQLSASSGKALDQLYCGMEWYDLMNAWLSDPANRSGWVEVNSLTALGR